ncbi:hypothetical protein AB0I60_14710 [Actinosynnema sp. NPDC050436]|uniref:hypothetical protein n=1 Tax=Actinosynnema sp. NPDC050436 TaxID=3155659 RepID=UPI0033D5F592
MGKIRSIFVGVAVAVLALTGTVTANAEPAQVDEARVLEAGYFHAYRDNHFQNECKRWLYDSSNWGQCANQASSVWNDGIPGNLDDVWVYRNFNSDTPGRGIYRGTKIAVLGALNFDGTNVSMDNEIVRHKWVNLP